MLKEYKNIKEKKYVKYHFLIDLLIVILTIFILIYPILDLMISSFLDIIEDQFSSFSFLRNISMITLGIYSVFIAIIIYKKAFPKDKIT